MHPRGFLVLASPLLCLLSACPSPGSDGNADSGTGTTSGDGDGDGDGDGESSSSTGEEPEPCTEFYQSPGGAGCAIGESVFSVQGGTVCALPCENLPRCPEQCGDAIPACAGTNGDPNSTVDPMCMLVCSENEDCPIGATCFPYGDSSICIWE